MKKVKILILCPLFLVLVTCKKSTPELGSLPDKSTIKFSVTQDMQIDPGGNTVILKNETLGIIPMWDYGTGRSSKTIDTIRIPFKGSYIIRFSALTQAGVVKCDSVVISITTDNLSYVNGIEWNTLAGGVGNEKSWVLDVNGKLFNGALSFYDPNNYGTLWWAPASSDVMTVSDYGVMTFSLKGGPFYHDVKPMEGGIEENGTYFVDAASKKLVITGASILRGYKTAKNGIIGVSNWSNYYLFGLTDSTLQLGVIRDRDVDGEGLVLMVYNFISKQYSDNWVAPPTKPDEGFNPVFASGQLLQMLVGDNTWGRYWNLDANGNAVDWIAKGKGWTTSSSSSRDWGWNDTWVTAVSDGWIRFDHIGGTNNYSRFQSGTLTTGTFTVDETKNEINLGTNTLLQNSGNWMNPSANIIKVVKAFIGAEQTKGIWFGTSYDPTKDEWLSFHYIIPKN